MPRYPNKQLGSRPRPHLNCLGSRPKVYFQDYFDLGSRTRTHLNCLGSRPKFYLQGVCDAMISLEQNGSRPCVETIPDSDGKPCSRTFELCLGASFWSHNQGFPKIWSILPCLPTLSLSMRGSNRLLPWFPITLGPPSFAYWVRPWTSMKSKTKTP